MTDNNINPEDIITGLKVKIESDGPALKVRGIGTSGSGGGGTSNYNELINKPSINNIPLIGNKTLESIGFPSNLPNPYALKIKQANEDDIIYDGSSAQEISISSASISNVSSDSPIGTIIAYMGTSAPENYLMCNGSVYQISAYPKLAKHLEDELGSKNFFGGDGVSTFAVPDLRGEFLRGTGTAARQSGSGADVGVHQPATRQLINGVNTSTEYEYYKRDGNSTSSFYDIAYQDVLIASDNPKAYISKVSVDSSNPNPNVMYTTRPTNTAVLYCIKYSDGYNSKVDLDHAYIGIESNYAPVEGSIIPIIIKDGNMEINAGKLNLRGGSTYQFICSFAYANNGVDQHANIIYSFTSSKPTPHTVAQIQPYRGTSDFENPFSSSFQYTPEEDCELYILTSNILVPDIINANRFALSVFEIGKRY